jgi:hypothetical protein
MILPTLFSILAQVLTGHLEERVQRGRMLKLLFPLDQNPMSKHCADSLPEGPVTLQLTMAAYQRWL